MTINSTNGGWYQYPDSQRPLEFFRATDRCTKSVTISKGQVLKRYTFLETLPNGESIAHTGIGNQVKVTFPALAANKTLIIGGLTFSSGSSDLSALAVANAFAGIAKGSTATQINTQKSLAGATGTFTAGTLANYFTVLEDSHSVRFVPIAASVDYTALTNTGNGTATFDIILGNKKPSGVILYDVDARANSVVAEAFCEASFWASALVWSADPAVDTISLSDNTTIPVTFYDTFATSQLLKQKFVENTEFCELGFMHEGEVALLNRGELR